MTSPSTAKMKVTLIDYTGKIPSYVRQLLNVARRNDKELNEMEANYAAALLIYTKSTRLQMSPSLFDEILKWHIERKMKELEYMANTIPSSWEFVDYTFQIEGVTRAFTHQFVRTRTASFAQQTMRILNVDGWKYLTGPSIKNNPLAEKKYDAVMAVIADQYDELNHGAGVEIEDARGILPTNILTNITAKMNMRTFVELVRKRSSSRVQGEYRDVLEAMKEEVKRVHPWIHLFIERTHDVAANELDKMIREMGTYDEKKQHMIKLLDQMRSQS